MTSPQSTRRLHFFDNLRAALTLLVVAHHACQAYGPGTLAWPVRSLGQWPALGAFLSVSAAFFMGLFFFIAGYLTEGSYERKGARRYLRDRFVRLGVPLLVMALAVHLPARWIMSGSPPFWGYLTGVYMQDGLTMVGHLWFLCHLLVYALAYVAYRRWAGPDRAVTAEPLPPPGHKGIALYALALAVVGGIVRVGFPIDRWITVGFVPVEVAHWPQYVSLYLLGIVAWRNDWLRRLETRVGMIWLGVGVLAAAAGGWWPRGAAYGALWEALVCVGLCVGLLTLARERLDTRRGIWPFLAGGAYGVYLVHVAVVVACQLILELYPLRTITRLSITFGVGVVGSYAIAYVLQDLPGLRRLL